MYVDEFAVYVYGRMQAWECGYDNKEWEETISILHILHTCTCILATIYNKQ